MTHAQSTAASGLRQSLRGLLPAIVVLPVISLIAAGLVAGTTEGPPAVAEAPAGGAQVVALSQPLVDGAVPPGAGQRVFFLNMAPDIVAGTTPPHANRGSCGQCHRILSRSAPAPAAPAMFAPVAQQQAPAASSGPPAGAAQTLLQMTPYQRVYWQGLELVPLGHSLAAALGVPDQTQGVVVASASLPAGAEGFIAGDVISAVGDQPTPDLQRFWEAARAVSAQPTVELSVLRGGQRRRLVLSATAGSLGAASGVTAPVIVQGSQPPHGPRGACGSCHLQVPRAGAGR